MKEIHPLALFRLSVLGALVSRELLHLGELQKSIRLLAQCEYVIPGSQPVAYTHLDVYKRQRAALCDAGATGLACEATPLSFGCAAGLPSWADTLTKSHCGEMSCKT